MFQLTNYSDSEETNLPLESEFPLGSKYDIHFCYKFNCRPIKDDKSPSLILDTADIPVLVSTLLRLILL